MKFVTTLLLAGLAIPAIAQETMPLGRALENVQQTIQIQCESAKFQLEMSSTDEQKDAAKQAIELSCTCFPHELEKAASLHGGMQSTIPVTQDQSLSIAKAAYAVCAAQGIRTQFKPACMRDDRSAAGIPDRAAYCACITDSLAKVEDLKLMEAAMTAHSNFQKKVDARKRGEPAPREDATVIDEAVNACKDKHRK